MDALPVCGCSCMFVVVVLNARDSSWWRRRVHFSLWLVHATAACCLLLHMHDQLSMLWSDYYTRELLIAA